MEFILKYKSLQEIQQNPVWIKLQSKGTDKKQLNEQFLSLTEDEKVIAIDLFESSRLLISNSIRSSPALISGKFFTGIIVISFISLYLFY